MAEDEERDWEAEISDAEFYEREEQADLAAERYENKWWRD